VRVRNENARRESPADSGAESYAPRLRRRVSRPLLAVCAVVVALAAVAILGAAHEAPGATGPAATLFMDPHSVTVAPGATVTVDVRVSIEDDSANAVQADIAYPESLLSYVSTSVNAATWGVTASTAGGSGLVSVQVGATAPVTGDQRVATVTFTGTAAGTATLSFAASSAVLSATTNTNLLPTAGDGGGGGSGNGGSAGSTGDRSTGSSGAAPSSGGSPLPTRAARGTLSLTRIPASLHVSGSGALTLTVRCSGRATCQGILRLTAARSHAQAAAANILSLASARYRIAAGKQAKLKLRLSAAGRALLRRCHGTLRATLTVTPAGAKRASVRRTVRLKAAHVERHRGGLAHVAKLPA
jgi:hypothetical protein